MDIQNGTKHLESLPADQLEAIFTDFYTSKGRFNYAKPEFVNLAEVVGWRNLTTLMLKVAEIAYMKDVLDEDDYLRLQEEG